MDLLNNGYYNSQAVQVLNAVEYDEFDNPIGLYESPSDPSSCNFTVSDNSRCKFVESNCYFGNNLSYITTAHNISLYKNLIGFDIDFIWDGNYTTVSNGVYTTSLISMNRLGVSGFVLFIEDGVLKYRVGGVDNTGIENLLTITQNIHYKIRYISSFIIQINDINVISNKTSQSIQHTEHYGFKIGASGTVSLTQYFGGKLWNVKLYELDSSGNTISTLGYWPLCEPIINPSGHIYHDVSGNRNHATLINGSLGNEGKQNEFHYLQKGFNKSGATFLPKHLTNNIDCLGNTLTYVQDGKSFLPSGCYLQQYSTNTNLKTADSTVGFWYGPEGDPYKVSYNTLCLQDPWNEQVFIGNKTKDYKLGPISTHYNNLTSVQKLTERIVRNVVDDPLIEDPAFSHDVTVTASDLTYSLYNVNGYTMNGIIDWGDGTTQSVNTTATQTITKTYSAAGTYTVKVTGTIQYIKPLAFSAVNATKIVKINNWGNCDIKLLSLNNCTNLTTIPNGPITGLNQTSCNLQDLFYINGKLTGQIPDNFLINAKACTNLRSLFYNCIGLTGQIPENLFRYCPNLTDVSQVFQGCTGLTGQIPEALLKYNTKLTSVVNLFNGCSGLSGSIPENLFINCPLITTLQSTFRDCSNLIGSIPTNLFKPITELVNVVNCFLRCSKLTGVIPNDLFRYNIKLQRVAGVFQSCVGLTGSIPANLLTYNVEVYDVSYMFAGCTGLTGAIPSNLFATNTLITTFASTFDSCPGLTGISADLFRYSGTATLSFEYTFTGCTGITSIPTGLFDYNTNVTTFAGAFRRTRITTIPSNLFVNNTKVKSFNYTFGENPSLSAIPGNLFDTNTLVTTFANVFDGCPGITSIPTDLFRYNELVTGMSAVFNNTRITAIPVDIFRYNTLVTSFAYTFAGIGRTNTIALPVGLFNYNINVITFSDTFNGTKCIFDNTLFSNNVAATNFTNTFFASNITEIPSGLFDNNINAQFMNYTFYGYNGTTIPTDLFRYNKLVTTFDSCFYNSVNLTTIPTDLFRYNPEVTSFGGTSIYGIFGLCGSLRNIPEDLFYYNTKVITYLSVFRGTRNLILPTRLFNTANLGKVTSWTNFLNVTSTTHSPTGTIQKIWDVSEGGDVTYTVQPTKADAFNNCTAISNYSEIPVAWT